MPISQASNSYSTPNVGRALKSAMDAVRKRLVNALENEGLTLKDASLRIGRNHAYLQQFVERGIPASLKESDRMKLATLLRVPESELGAPNKAGLPRADNSNVSNVPEYQVHVSAGGGALVVEENKRRDWPFATDYLKSELGLGRSKLGIVEVRGDSMEPTLSSGDRVLVNMSDRQVSQPGIFIIFDGDGTVIKRVEKIPGTVPPRIVLISDNPLHGRYELDSEVVQIVGRVVWRAGRI